MHRYLPSLETVKVALLAVIAVTLLTPHIRAIFDAPAFAQSEERTPSPENRVQDVRIVQTPVLVVRPENSAQFFPVNTLVCGGFPQVCYIRTRQN